MKSTLGYPSAELVYGSNLVLPGSMIVPLAASTASITDSSSYVERLCSYISMLPLMCPRAKVISSCVPKDIHWQWELEVHNRGDFNGSSISLPVQFFILDEIFSHLRRTRTYQAF